MFRKLAAFAILMTVFTLASVGFAAESISLMPADSAVCRYSGTHTVYCFDGEFYHDQYGRCGCLNENEYYPQEYCNVSFILCDEAAGELFSMLFLSNRGATLPVGCGCFSTSPS